MQMKARYEVCYALSLSKHFTQAINFGFHENFERSTFACIGYGIQFNIYIFCVFESKSKCNQYGLP